MIIFTDGACSGNPGPGGWGSIICLHREKIIELGGANPSTTNNQMELSAVINSLKYLNLKKGDVHIYTDSTYVIRGASQWIWGWLRKGWKNSEGGAVANKDLWEQMFEYLKNKSLKIHWEYVRGHTGVAGNERCDQIAVAKSKNDPLFLYQGDLSKYPVPLFPLPPSQPLPESKWDGDKKKSEISYYLCYVNGELKKYTQWSDCERAVKGVSGAKFKKITSEVEESEILKKWGLSV